MVSYVGGCIIVILEMILIKLGGNQKLKCWNMAQHDAILTPAAVVFQPEVK